MYQYNNMPLPETKDVGKIIKYLKKEKPGQSKDQRIAIALTQAGKSKKDRQVNSLKTMK